MSPAPDPAWERRHPESVEAWSFDFLAADAGLGGFVGLALHPAPRPVAWYWAALVGEGRPYLLVRDLEIEAPRRPGSREIRSDGLWADVNCETPFEHWSLGLEAFGVAMDDPDEALGAECGDRIGLGLDLEWEVSGGAGALVGAAGNYAQPCDVYGEILVGVGSEVETIAFEGHGWRRHGWGEGATPRSGEGLWGRLDDGTPFQQPAVPEGGIARHQPAVPDVGVVARAPLRLAEGILERSLCRFTATAGIAGAGWQEAYQAPNSPAS